VLNSERTPEMRQIVETIQAAQSALIGSDPDQVLVVQGGPGTGKTAVALHRLSAILYNEQSVSPSDVLVIGPNETFTRYIARVLPQLGDEDVEITDVNRMLGSRVVVSTRESSDAAKLKGDLRMVEVLRRGLADRVRVPQEPLAFSVIGVPWRARVEPELLRRLIDGQAAVLQNVGRNAFRERLKNAVVSQVRARMEGDRLPVRGDLAMLLDATEIESAVDRIWPRLSPQAFLRELYGSLERLVNAAGSALTADEIGLLRRTAGPRVAEQLWSKEDLVLLDEVAHLMGERAARYSHTVVDEAQDLSPLQVRAIARRSGTGAMTLVGDIAQSTGHWARDSWDDILDLIETSLPKHVQHLEFGYRVPRSVMELASRLLPIAAPAIEAPRVVREVPNSVRVTEVGDADELAQRVVDLVREHSGYGRFVGVVCPDERRPEVAEAFRKSGLSWQDANKGSLGASINLVSPVASKGLEFDAVVIVDPQLIVEAGPEGFRMLYVAMTRTTKYLDIVHPEGALPAPLRDDDGIGAPTVDAHPFYESADMGATTATRPAPRGEHADRRGPSGGRATGLRDFTPRQQKVIDREAEDLIGSLEETVPPALWCAVLARAMDMLERD
jgi:DNA helicase IV